MTSYSTIFNELTTEPTYDGSNGEFEIPAPWLIPRAFIVSLSSDSVSS